jgi:hypothetical protein
LILLAISEAWLRVASELDAMNDPEWQETRQRDSNARLLASMLAALIIDSQCSSGIPNPDRQYYQGAARGCGGGAYCYRSSWHKIQKQH